MPELRFTLTVEQDGVPLADMPIVRRYVVNQTSGPSNLVAAADNNTSSYHAIAAIVQNPENVFLLTTDQALNLKINLNTPLPLNAGGLILVLGGNLTQATPSQNVEYNNPAASISANLGILTGGT